MLKQALYCMSKHFILFIVFIITSHFYMILFELILVFTAWGALWGKCTVRETAHVTTDPSRFLSGKQKKPVFDKGSNKVLRVLCSVWLTDLDASATASVSVDVIQREDLKGGERSGAGLRGDHPTETRHRPGAHVIVVCTNWSKNNTRKKKHTNKTP